MKISKREWDDNTVCTPDLFVGIYARLPSSNDRTTEGGTENHKEASQHRVQSSSGRKRSIKEAHVNWSKKQLDNFKEKRKEEGEAPTINTSSSWQIRNYGKNLTA